MSDLEKSDTYRRWLENAARRGVPAETILDIVRRHHIGPDDISDDDARKAVLMTYILNAGTDHGSASTDNDFDETPYSADEVQRIIDRQERNDWSYKDDVDNPAAELRVAVQSGRSRFQQDDGTTYRGELDLDRLLHHEEVHSQQWADKGHSGFLRSYIWEQIRRRNDTEEDAGLRDGGYR